MATPLDSGEDGNIMLIGSVPDTHFIHTMLQPKEGGGGGGGGKCV